MFSRWASPVNHWVNPFSNQWLYNRNSAARPFEFSSIKAILTISTWQPFTSHSWWGRFRAVIKRKMCYSCVLDCNLLREADNYDHFPSSRLTSLFTKEDHEWPLGAVTSKCRLKLKTLSCSQIDLETFASATLDKPILCFFLTQCEMPRDSTFTLRMKH